MGWLDNKEKNNILKKIPADKIKNKIAKRIPFIAITLALVVYIIVVYIYQTSVIPKDDLVLEAEKATAWASFTNMITNKSFYYSFIASSYEDIVFFALIGISIFLYSLKRPEDEKLENRMNHLFTNNDSVDPFVLNEAKEKAKESAVYSPKTTIQMTIVEKINFDNKNLLKISVNRRVFLNSLIHDLNDVETKGCIEFIGEKNAKLPDDIYGEIELIELLYDVENINSIVTNRKLTDAQVDIEIDEVFKKDADFSLHTKFWMWMIDGDVYEHTAFRTTSNTEVSVKNNLSEDIILSESQKQKTIRKDEVVELELQSKGALKKGDTITIGIKSA